MARDTYNDPADTSTFEDRSVAGWMVRVARNERMPNGMVEIDVEFVGYVHPPQLDTTRATFVVEPSRPGEWGIADLMTGTELQLGVALMPRQVPCLSPSTA